MIKGEATRDGTKPRTTKTWLQADFTILVRDLGDKTAKMWHDAYVNTLNSRQTHSM